MLTRVITATSIFCLLLPAAASAQGFAHGDKTVTLSGGGASDNEFVGNNFSLEGTIGYFLTDGLELAFRQGLAYNDVPRGDDEWSAASRVAADYNFDLGRVWPFVGASLGYIYGDGVADTWVAGPEAGVRVFVNDTTFILGLIEYEFFFDDSEDAKDKFDDGRFVYTLGIGFRWQ